MTIAVDMGRKATKTTKKQQQQFHVLNCFIKYVLDSNGEQTTCSCNLKLICYLFNQEVKNLK